MRRTGRVLFRLGLLLAVSAAALALWTWDVATRAEAERERLALIVSAAVPADFAPQPVPEEANAMPAFLAAAADLPPDALAHPERARRLVALRLAEWTEEDVELARRIAAKHGGVLTRLLEAGAQPAAGLNLDYGEGPDPDPAAGLALLGAARLLCLEACRALADGDAAAARASWSSLARLAHGLRREPPVILQLLGSAAERLALQLVHEVVARPGGDRVLRARMAAELEHLGQLPSAFDSLRYEALLGLGYAARLEEGLGPVRLWLRRRLGAPWLLDVEGYYCRERELLEVARGGGFDEIDRVARGESVGCPRATAAAMMMPNLADALVKLRAGEAARDLALAALAARRHAEVTGAYPVSLAEAAASAPVAALTGEAAIYERRPDGSARLALPRLEAAWEARYGHLGVPGALPLDYHLPPP